MSATQLLFLEIHVSGHENHSDFIFSIYNLSSLVKPYRRILSLTFYYILTALSIQKCLLLSILSFPVIIYKHENCHQADNSISEETPAVRHLPEDEETEHRREDQLRIIVDGNTARRGIAVCRRDRKLSARRRAVRQKQDPHLLPGHRMIVKISHGSTTTQENTEKTARSRSFSPASPSFRTIVYAAPAQMPPKSPAATAQVPDWRMSALPRIYCRETHRRSAKAELA